MNKDSLCGLYGRTGQKPWMLDGVSLWILTLSYTQGKEWEALKYVSGKSEALQTV